MQIFNYCIELCHFYALIQDLVEQIHNLSFQSDNYKWKHFPIYADGSVDGFSILDITLSPLKVKSKQFRKKVVFTLSLTFIIPSNESSDDKFPAKN